MSQNIVLKKGLDLPIKGAADLRVSKTVFSDIVAVQPSEFKGLLPRLLVKEGDTVKKGDLIGKVGTTGLTNGNTLHLGLSVFDVPVSIYPLWENDGISIVDPS